MLSFLNSVLTALGYMTEREAYFNGFLYHARYYGIPCWISDPYQGMNVATKWWPMELLLIVAIAIESTCYTLMGAPEHERGFNFYIVKPIDETKYSQK